MGDSDSYGNHARNCPAALARTLGIATAVLWSIAAVFSLPGKRRHR